ncbi:MAG: M1 family aminopeptidase [Candidatus Krumholzibacteriia bacterium]
MRRFLLVLAAVSALFAATLPARAVPMTGSDDPDQQRAAVLAHRFAEADAKAALTRELQRAEALRTVNQDQYDVTHYDLDLTLSPGTATLSGTAAATVTVVGTPIATVDLDLRSNMAVSSATVGGAATTFTRAGHLVAVDLDRTYDPGESVTVSVTYSGNPAGEYFGWDSFGGQTMIWTLSEPFGARSWWPCKDVNTDKPDAMDIRVTVPPNLIVASNGRLLSDADNGTTRTFHWRTDYPIATYLVSLAIHPYSQYSDWYTPLDGGAPMEVAFYVFPSHFDQVQATYALTVPMIGAFAQGYGEYPFVDEKYGHAEFTWGGGMEHQTLTSLGGWSEDLISHELAHQWWGDMVSCADFGHIWLNEGFATWSEAYWKEVSDGVDTYRQYMDYAAYYGGGTIFVEDPLNDNIFDGNLSYNKGSWVVHMLRGVVGDQAFFDSLALYRQRHLYGSATTEDLRDAMEQTSGRDLDAFFQQWIYGAYFPEYSFGWTAGPGAGQITVTIAQNQTATGLFTMPIPLRITTDQGVQNVRVENSQASQDYVIDVAGAVESVAFDPDGWILCRVQTSVANPSFSDGILLVNGVHWPTYTTEITTAYLDSVFTGQQAYDFWDCFPTPSGGYPASLPEPLGHGSVPADVLARYSAVVWVGNDYSGDLNSWFETPIRSYLEVGGNVLLLCRRSANFLDANLASYLAVTWAETDATLANCTAAVPELASLPFTGTQSFNDVYRTTVGPNTTILFQDTSGFGAVRGVGARVVPPGGGADRPDGGQLVHIGARPYRLQHAALRADTEVILADYFGEPYHGTTAAPAGDDAPAAAVALGSAFPNPFNPQTVIPLRLTADTRVNLALYDARGRHVVTLRDEVLPAGRHEVRWDGRDGGGRSVASGTYFARLRTGLGPEQTRALMLVR